MIKREDNTQLPLSSVSSSTYTYQPDAIPSADIATSAAARGNNGNGNGNENEHYETNNDYINGENNEENDYDNDDYFRKEEKEENNDDDDGIDDDDPVVRIIDLYLSTTAAPLQSQQQLLQNAPSSTMEQSPSTTNTTTTNPNEKSNTNLLHLIQFPLIPSTFSSGNELTSTSTTFSNNSSSETNNVTSPNAKKQTKQQRKALEQFKKKRQHPPLPDAARIRPNHGLIECDYPVPPSLLGGGGKDKGGPGGGDDKEDGMGRMSGTTFGQSKNRQEVDNVMMSSNNMMDTDNTIPNASARRRRPTRTLSGIPVPIHTHLAIAKYHPETTQRIIKTSQNKTSTINVDRIDMVPLHHVIPLRPTMSHIDDADLEEAANSTPGSINESDKPKSKKDGSSAKANNKVVGFARPETERGKERREAGFAHLIAQRESEDWIELDVRGISGADLVRNEILNRFSPPIISSSNHNFSSSTDLASQQLIEPHEFDYDDENYDTVTNNNQQQQQQNQQEDELEYAKGTIDNQNNIEYVQQLNYLPSRFDNSEHTLPPPSTSSFFRIPGEGDDLNDNEDDGAISIDDIALDERAKELASRAAKVMSATGGAPVPHAAVRCQFATNHSSSNNNDKTEDIPTTHNITDRELAQALSGCAALVRGNWIIRSSTMGLSIQTALARDLIVCLFVKLGRVRRHGVFYALKIGNFRIDEIRNGVGVSSMNDDDEDEDEGEDDNDDDEHNNNDYNNDDTPKVDVTHETIDAIFNSVGRKGYGGGCGDIPIEVDYNIQPKDYDTMVDYNEESAAGYVLRVNDDPYPIAERFGIDIAKAHKHYWERMMMEEGGNGNGDEEFDDDCEKGGRLLPYVRRYEEWCSR